MCYDKRMDWPTLLVQEPTEPLHLRIRRGIRAAVQSGALHPGEQLPGIRALASLMQVNRLTVLKAVRALSRAGLLTTVKGKGVFVLSDPRLGPEARDLPESPFLEGLAEGPEPDAAPDGLQQALDAAPAPGGLSFAAGFPPPEAIPIDTIRVRLGRLLREGQAAVHLGYLPSEGDPVLLRELHELLRERGLVLGPDDRVLVTSGAQQALALCLDALQRPGESLAIESPGYVGAITACQLRRLPMVPVPVDDGGVNPDRLESALRKHELFALYTVPNFQNPTAVTQSLRRRAQILELAARRDTVIIEDDVYGDLRFGGHRVPPLKSLPGGERVVYIGSFSKSLAPGLRVGFLVASGAVAERLVRGKGATDISTCALAQGLVGDLLRTGYYRRHLVRIRRIYRERRDAMVAALAESLPEGVRFTRPRGGLHLWVMSDHPADADRLLEVSRRQGVLFSPGRLFFSDNRRSSSFRLNYASHSPEQIRDGVRRLVGCLRRLARRSS
jgi:DNA-binding transcriptional MocR family regulator